MEPVGNDKLAIVAPLATLQHIQSARVYRMAARACSVVLLDKAGQVSPQARLAMFDKDGYDIVVYAGTYLTHRKDGSVETFKKIVIAK